MTREDFEQWVEQDLLPTLEPGDIVIWDNLNIHYSARVRYVLNRAQCLVVFQSRYSPDLNPIEKAWSKLKAHVRRHRPKGAREMKKALTQAWNSVTSQDIAGYFKHCLVDNVCKPMW